MLNGKNTINEKTIYAERHKRLKKLSLVEPEIELDMFLGFSVTKKLYSGLRAAVKIYLYDCLSEWHSTKVFDLELDIDDFVKIYRSEIKVLPNITPNGLILPKKELLCSYNLILKKCVDLITYLGLDKTCVSAYMPINIRVIFGEKISEVVEARPRSTTIWHSDIWAAQSAQECVLHTPITGDFVKNGISTAYPPSGFFPDFVRPLDKFVNAEHLITKEFLDNNIYKHSMVKGNVYIMDSFLFHKTEKKEKDCRIVLSFPLVPKGKLESDIYDTETRKNDYVEMSEWTRFGTEKFLYTAKSLEKFNIKDVGALGYADSFHILEVK